MILELLGRLTSLHPYASEPPRTGHWQAYKCVYGGCHMVLVEEMSGMISGRISVKYRKATIYQTLTWLSETIRKQPQEPGHIMEWDVAGRQR